MADGTVWRTALGALSALGLGAVGVAFVPPLLVPGETALESQVAALPDVAASEEPASPDPATTAAAGIEATADPEAVVPQDGDPSSEAIEASSSAEQDALIAQEPQSTIETAPAVQVEGAPDPRAPSFDTIRVEPDGTGLVAGRAEPGAEVAILAGEDVAAEITADPNGRFVAFFALSPSAQPRVLFLRDGSGAISAETVIVAPNATEEEVAALHSAAITEAGAGSEVPNDRPDELAVGQGTASVAASADPGRPSLPNAPGAAPSPPSAAGSPAAPFATASDADLGTRADQPPGSGGRVSPAPYVAATAPQPPGPVEAQPAAQEAVLLSDAEGVRVVQPALAPGATAEVLATVALDAIAYDGSGEVVLSGRATDAGAVRLYLDNAPVADAGIAADGTWSVPLTGTSAGIYTLRVDQLDASGAVVSRIETPFQREERGSLEAALAEAGRMSNGIALRTVQPGNTLWAIARERYGEPRFYLRVFEANRDRIRNPDLIYPGQVFVLPDLD